MTTETTLAETIQRQLMTIPGLRQVDCKPLQSGVSIAGSHCFLSRDEQDVLLKKVQVAMKPVGSTPGWSDDYSVWGAFYTATGDRQLTFGVNVLQIAGDRVLEASPLTKGYRSIVNFVVDARHVP